MKGKINKIINIVVLVTLVLLMVSRVFAAVPEEPHPGDAMWVEPSTIDLSTDTVSVGYRFNVTIWINLTVASASWQFKLAYNKNHLNATGCGYTAGDKSDFFKDINTVSLEPSFGTLNTTHNYVLHGEVAFTSQRDPGYGSLAWVEFEVMTVPPEGETYTSKLAMVEVYPDGTETYAQDPEQNKIPLNVYESTYIIPEFSGFLFFVLVICLALILLFQKTRKR